MHRVEVPLADQPYQVIVGSSAIADSHDDIRGVLSSKANKVLLVVDSGVHHSVSERIVAFLKSIGIDTKSVKLTPTEKMKTLDTVERLLCEAALFGLTRSDAVIALGGGVIGDIAGFVAASYQRGVQVIQCPTTLLSMVDASVGGKTGVNLSVQDSGFSGGIGSELEDTEQEIGALYKNLVGAFHQPAIVLADISVLETLDKRYRRSGLAECVKHGMIGSGIGGNHAILMDWMIEHQCAICSFEPLILEELVARNVALKAEVVSRDERESIEGRSGGRMLLNFGHTFGHAIETIDELTPDHHQPELAPLHHGEAVALGMVAACRCAEHIDIVDESIGNELVNLLQGLGLPTQVNGLPDSNELIERMSHDKKASGGHLRLILPVSHGVCEIRSDVSYDAIEAGFDAIRM